jgi:signal transduction histidine kinase
MKASPTRLINGQQLWWWVAVSVFAITNFSVSVPVAATIYAVPVLAAFAVGFLQSGSVALSLIAPRLSVAAWLAGTALFFVYAPPSPDAPWPLDVNGLLALCALLLTLGFRRPIREGVIAWALAVAATLVMLVVVGTGGTHAVPVAGVVANLVTSTGISAFVLLLGILLAQRGQARGQLAAEQQKRGLVEERNRIARELHDVVAHSMSVIQVQASSAPYRLPQLDASAREEFADIATSARAAIREMRQLLGVLRSESVGVEEMPQPGVPQIGELVPPLERAGVMVAVHLDPALPADGVASAAAYRIAQESLSNVVRHAPGARVEVRAELFDHSIALSVENSAPTGSAAVLPAKGGHGIIGMRERAALLGGTMNAGPTTGGGYRVLAILPLLSSTSEPRIDKDPAHS